MSLLNGVNHGKQPLNGEKKLQNIETRKVVEQQNKCRAR